MFPTISKIVPRFELKHTPLCSLIYWDWRVKTGNKAIHRLLTYHYTTSNDALVACWCRQVMAQAVTLGLMHSGIVNGYQLLWDAHTVLNHIGIFSFFLFYSLPSFSTSFFLCVCHYECPISFLGCLYSLC